MLPARTTEPKRKNPLAAFGLSGLDVELDLGLALGVQNTAEALIALHEVVQLGPQQGLAFVLHQGAKRQIGQELGDAGLVIGAAWVQGAQSG